MLCEQGKVWLLALCFAAALATIFTSHSFELGPRDLPTLRPTSTVSSSAEGCRAPRQALQQCQRQQKQSIEIKNGSSANVGNLRSPNSAAAVAVQDCSKLVENVSRCEKAVQRAYRHINLGGCPFENQMNALCEMEWCIQQQPDRQACERECAVVRGNLNDCIQKHLKYYLDRYGVFTSSKAIADES